jgi:cob(I)alamin adenosyltransferase
MAYRLTKISTRTGDDGTTGLGDGSRVSKASARIDMLGTIDELNCALGLVLTEALPDKIRALLTDIQHDLFDLGGELCIPGSTLLDISRVEILERAVAQYNAHLPPLTEFILPGGCRASAFTHQARAVCRRTERVLIALSEAEPVAEVPRVYLNRLSDLLFVLARSINAATGEKDVMWARKGPAN